MRRVGIVPRFRLPSFVKSAGLGVIAVLSSAHVGSPDVFFAGRAGPYDVRVVVRPPQVVPGVARVTVRAPADAQSVSIRPVFWRAGSRGAPSADESRRLDGQSGTFEGSLWLMARGAYTVDVIVSGARGTANVLVPVASVATGRLAMNPVLGALLVVLGLTLVAGMVNIVYKGAGESLVRAGSHLDIAGQRRARRAAAIAVPILGLSILGGAYWWGAVDQEYEDTMYRPTPLRLVMQGSVLEVQATDTVWQAGRPSGLLADHGKLMHLFLVRVGDAGAFAHLHPRAADSSTNPALRTVLPALPGGAYHVFGDVVHETGFERTLVGSLTLPDRSNTTATRETTDPDDAWFTGDAAQHRTTKLSDGSTMTIALAAQAPEAGREETIRVDVRDERGEPARLEPYLGMSAHAVVTRMDGSVYVHLHPMGTVTLAAQQAFLARDRGDTTRFGTPRLVADHSVHAAQQQSAAAATTEFPYAFPKGGDYRLFVQVRRGGRVLTGAFAIPVAEPSVAAR